MTNSEWIAVGALAATIITALGWIGALLFKAGSTLAEIKAEIKTILVTLSRMEHHLNKHDSRIRRLEKKGR
jgi:hypothetical protein